jgi:hypothetical protein
MKKVRVTVGSRAILGSVGAVALGLAACGMQDPAGPDASWTQVTERTACEAMNPSFCAGTYGFTVMSDGRYTVGPADNGTQVGGSISDSAHARLSADAARVAGGLGGSQQCDTAGSVPGVGDAVDLTDAYGALWRVYDLGVKGTCFRGGRDPATRLHDDLRALMVSYYPRPFPP